MFTSYMQEAGYIQSSADPCVFVQAEERDVTIIAVYVDNVTTSSEKMSAVKKRLETRFKMKDLGKLAQQGWSVWFVCEFVCQFVCPPLLALFARSRHFQELFIQ